MIAGAGIFGVVSALALRRRGYAVTLVDPGPVPHPLAASTDITKAVRADYGPDEAYTDWMLEAIPLWREWSDRWGDGLFHETGVCYFSRAPMAHGGFEYESHRVLGERGVALERLDAREIARRFPAWSSGRYTDGYFNPLGGYVESGRVVARLAADARASGVIVREGVPIVSVAERGGRAVGVVLGDGATLEADVTVCALGAWSHHLLPHLAGSVRSTGHPVFHLRPERGEMFEWERFPTFGADIAETGWYGFPLHPREGVVKVARHSAGREMHPASPERAVTASELAGLGDFLAETFPALVTAPVVATRVCLYSDTWDGHLWIDHDPERPGLVVATGDAGHAFKFAPVLGELVADVIERRKHPMARRFRWRPEQRPPRSEEAARHQR